MSPTDTTMKVVINCSFTCNMNPPCPYCWLPHTKINRDAKEHKWQEWAAALIRHLPAGSIVDLSGGEPTLYDGFELLCDELGKHGIKWAITTNAMYTEGVNKLIDLHPAGCVVINISDHPGNMYARQNIDRLCSVFPFTKHRVIHEGAGYHEEKIGQIQYQPWAEGNALDGVKRKCNAGINHWVIDPGGDVFRCCVDMQVANKPLGNIFDDTVKKPDKPFVCDFGCSFCYTTEPHAWLLEMETVK